jgi:hypothetical protein
MRAKKEVARIDAGWIVAAVEHKQASGYWSDMRLIGKTMRARSLAAESQDPVTVFALCPVPRPAVVGTETNDVSVESLDQRLWLRYRQSACRFLLKTAARSHSPVPKANPVRTVQLSAVADALPYHVSKSIASSLPEDRQAVEFLPGHIDKRAHCFSLIRIHHYT